MSIKEIQTGAIIIGAGPAGCGTSFQLSKKKIAHVVIEKATFPRDKICGDACGSKGAEVVRRANPQWYDELIAHPSLLPIMGLSFYAPNGNGVHFSFGDHQIKNKAVPMFTMPRLELDNFLFSKLPSDYCTILQGATVEKVEKNGNTYSVTVRHNGTTYLYTSPALIGADGEKSIVARKFLPRPEGVKANAVGLRAYYSGITGYEQPNYIELHFLPELVPGYLWIFPLPDGRANVGVGMMSSIVRKERINLKEKMIYAINHNPKLRERFKNAVMEDKIHGWGLSLAMQQQLMSGDGLMLTGDAAALIDPSTGEGIGNALYSGMMAGDAVEKCYSQNNFTAGFIKQVYDNDFYQRFGTELKLSAIQHKMSYYPKFINWVVNKTMKSPSLKETLNRMLWDEEARKQLSKPSFYLKILLNK